MSDLISRQAAILAIRKTAEPLYRGEDNVIPAEYEDAIMKLPTIDAVPVVRCRECKNWEYDTIFSDGWCRGKHQGNPDWFCADGERSEE